MTSDPKPQNLNTLMIYIMSHRSGPNYELGIWLASHKLNYARGSQIGFSKVDLIRNITIRSFLENEVPKGATHMMMIDGDMVPTIETTSLVRYTGEFASAAYAGNNGTTGHKTTFGAGMFKISAAALMKMEKPYFKVQTNDDMDEVIACECDWFSAQAEKAGIKHEVIGSVGHKMEIVTFPAKNKLGYEFAWNHELPYPNT